MIKVNRKIFKILYRLTLPGSLLLVFSALLIRVGVLADPQSPIVRFLPAVVFGVGLALSAGVDLVAPEEQELASL